MATANLRDMEGFIPLLTIADTKQKLTVGQELLTYLQSGSPIECSDIGTVIDSLLPWIQSSNFKVSQMGIDVTTELAMRMGCHFKPYIPSVLPVVTDRLGDSKELVRDRCQLLLQKVLEGGALTPQQLFERLSSAFSHKNSNVREEVLKCLITTLNQHGASSLSVSKLLPSIVRLLADPSSQVRDATFNALADIYRHVGDRLRNDLIKKYPVPQAKLPALLAKFDEIRAAGDLLPKAYQNMNVSLEEDETDRAAVPSSKRINSALPRKNVLTSSKSLCQTPSQAGAVDEDSFLKAFEDVPSIQIFSARDLEETLNSIEQVISNPANDWNKRVEALKKIRSLIVAGALQYEELYNHLRLLDPPFQISIKDLRSQVVREVCITLAYMSQQMKNKLDHFTESQIPVLFSLIQNSAKVIASCGQVCIGFLVTHTHSARLVPHICAPLSHKSRDIRRASVKFIYQILSSWNTHFLTKHALLLQNSVNAAIIDADQEVRMVARKAFWALKNQFPDHAESLVNSLDTTHKRYLQSDMSNSSSSNSLNQIQSTIPRQQRLLTGGSTENLSQVVQRRSSSSSIPVFRKDSESTPIRRPVTSMSTPRTASPRSNSAIDLQAAQRAKARAQYAAMARQKIGSNASLPRPRKTTSDSGPSSLVSSIVSPERSRQRTRTSSGVSQSQPSSRSGSPSSRLNYATAYGVYQEKSRRSPSYSRSTTGSRETSPCRFTPLPPLSKLRNRQGERNCLQPSRPPVMSQKILQQSMEAESALADALGYEGSNFSPTRRLRDDHSDDSETSSVCSERSFESYRRTSDSVSWSGSQQRIYRESWETIIKDINDIICAIESTLKNDRKDGLVSLSAYLQAGNTLNPHQLTKLTDNFTKMLSDSHTKIFSLFLDTVNDLIVVHSSELHPWLYILLTRLFNKLGGDILGSIQNKIHKTLQVIRENFGCEAMLHWALRFLVDATQTPNTKVKLSVLQFIAKVAPNADPSTAFPPSTPNKDRSRGDITTLALNKMIGWTMGESIKQGGSELRRTAQEAILALFNLNTPQITIRFSHLPKEYQEAAASLIHGRVRRVNSSGSTESSSLQSNIKQQDTLLSPDQVYRSLRKTTAEIQNYSFDGKVTDATSHDSGISQMSSSEKNDLDLITNWTTSLTLGSPTRVSSTINGLNQLPTSVNTSSGGGIDYSTSHIESGPHSTGLINNGDTTLAKVLDTIDGNGPGHKTALTQLSQLVEESDSSLLTLHFKRLLKILILELTSGEAEGKMVSLSLLSDMMKRKSLHEQFQPFIELILLRAVQAFGDSNKDVARYAEFCAGSIATLLKVDLVLKVLSPLISTQEFPLNLIAIKTLTKTVETKSKEEMMPLLSEIMPNLVQAYGNEESLVRKASVFCMVALHHKMGAEPLKPYLASLSTSKLKLLQLYIGRTQKTNNGSSPASALPTSKTNHHHSHP